MPVTKVKDVKAGNFVHKKTTKNTEKGFSRHFLNYNHVQDEGVTKGTPTFKCDFEVSFPGGLFWAKSEDSDYSPLKGKMVLNMSNPKVKRFVDTPFLGAVSGWVREKDVEQVEFSTFKAKKDIKLYEEANTDEQIGTVPADTVLTSDEKEDNFYHISYGGGEAGILYKIRKGVAKALWKKRKEAGIKKDKIKSEKELESKIKFPLVFHHDDKGNVQETVDWWIKISYMEGDGERDGFMAKYSVPGVKRNLTLEEMMKHNITGKPCFSVSNLYAGGETHSLQIYLSSMVVTDMKPVEFENPQQEEMKEYEGDEELVAKMRQLVPEKAPESSPSSKKTKGKKDKKSKDKKGKKKDKKSKKEESDSDSDDEPTNLKNIVGPSLEKVNENLDSDDSDSDIEVPGIDKKKGKAKGKKEESDSDDEKLESDDSDDEKPAKSKKKAKAKAKAKKEDSDDSDDEKPAKSKAKAKKEESDDSDDEKPAKGKKKAKAKKEESDSDSDE
jgi:hypothetical protein